MPTIHPAHKPSTRKLVAPTRVYTSVKGRPDPYITKKARTGLKEKTSQETTKGYSGKWMDINLSIVSDEEFDRYNKSEGKPLHTNIDYEIHLLPKENKLTEEEDHRSIRQEDEEIREIRSYRNSQQNCSKLTWKGESDIHRPSTVPIRFADREILGAIDQQL